MGILASIDIQLEKKLDFDFFSKILPLNGWDYNDYGFISYISIGEVDFEWTKTPYSEKEKVLSEIQIKLVQEEDIGVHITYEQMMIGGQLLYFNKSNLVALNININRVKDSSGKTNFEWYNEHYLKLFEDYGLQSIKRIETPQ